MAPKTPAVTSPYRMPPKTKRAVTAHWTPRQIESWMGAVAKPSSATVPVIRKTSW